MGTLARRLAMVEEQTMRLRGLSQQMGYERFSSDEDARMAVERRLHLCLEALMDVGLRLCSLMGVKRPGRYRDLSGALVGLGVLNEDEGRLLGRMISFRNVLVHLYADLDLKEVYEALTRADEIAGIAARLAQFVKKEGLDP